MEIDVATAKSAIIPTKQDTLALTTPNELLAQAVSSGQGVEVISKLMDLQDRWEKKESHKAFNFALSKAIAEIPEIVKYNTVDFTANGQRTHYKYEDLNTIAKAVKPVLERYGLSYRFRTSQDDSKVSVTCIVAHSDGYFEENTLSAGSDMGGKIKGIQAIASVVTYLERYTLKAALGLAVSNDDDGQKYSADDASDGRPVQFITVEQRDHLLKMMHDNDIPVDGFCAYFKIDSVSQIPASHYEKAAAAINKSIQQRRRANG